ncbi:MAG: hypothetical protein C0392_06020 [Syntrophus sp. (in: bacteria)]|nr:hypothetical protein [Syntrophus sp. (in: bacteria)]
MKYIILLFALVLPFYASAYDSITARAYLLVEKDSFQIIAGREYDKQLPPASTTKVVTTIVAIERLDGNEIVVPDGNVLKFPRSKLHLVPGNRYKSIDLLKGAMVESANDAAYTIATYVGGTEENFARLMNEKVKAIGALNSNFRNASGLSADNHYTTCYDLALIFRYALSNERFQELVTTKYFLFRDDKRSTRYKNHNRFLFCFDPNIGGKTGFTRASKHCYVGAFEKDGKVYILSLLGSRDLWGDSIQILKNLYQQLPSDREIRLAKAHSIALTSYKESKEKRHVVKKKQKKVKKSKKTSKA